MKRSRRLVLSTAVAAIVLMGGAIAARQVPQQARQAAGSALRPAVMGPSGGVSAGHPLTTAAAFRHPAEGRQRFRCRRRRRCSPAACSSRTFTASAAKALVLVYPKKERKVTSVVGQGWAPKAVDVDWYLSRSKNLRWRGTRSGGRARRAARGADRARTLGHDELRGGGGAGDRVRGARVSDARRAPRARSRVSTKFFESWPDNQKYWLKPDGSPYKPGETIKLPTLAQNLEADGRGRARARSRSGARPASSPPAIASTRATSPAKWSPSCRSTTRRST